MPALSVPRRDDLVALAVGAAALALMAAGAARTPAAQPWIWLPWAAAVPFLLLLSPTVQAALRASYLSGRALGWAVPAALGVFGAALGWASGAVDTWRWLAWPVVIGLAVATVGRDDRNEPEAWRLLAAALLLGVMAGLWDRALKIPVPGGTRLGFSFLCAVGLALFLLRIVRPLHTMDVRLGLSAHELGIALGVVPVLVAVAAPLGALADYVVWNPRPGGVLTSLQRLLGLVLFVGIPEELLFRGLVQEGLSRRRGPRFGLVVASLVFGVAHLGKFTGLLPEQQAYVLGLKVNWRYVILATLAGFAYGWVYRRTGKVSAAAVTHGAVDWLWSSFFLR